MITIDLILLIQILLPTSHQTVETVKYMEAAMKPLNDVQTSFYSYFNEVAYDLQFNGQVIYLEHLLNDLFDPIQRDIYISDAPTVEQTYLFNKNENNELTHLRNATEGGQPTYVFNASELPQYDYIINIPSGVSYNIAVIHAKMKKYGHAAKRYTIQTF